MVDAADAPGTPIYMKLRTHIPFVFLLALAVRLLHLGDSPWIDEFYHILAARSWLENGTLQIIADGREYGRAVLFTYLVAGVIALFGDSLEIARLPAVLLGALWVTAVFAWTWWVAGRLAAWIAGAWFALDAGAIVLSQFVRFYTLHGLLFFLGAAAVYALVVRRPERRIALPLVAGALVALAFADYFQMTTRIGVMALGLWVLIVDVPSIARRARRARTPSLIGVGVVVLAAGIAGFLIFQEQAALNWARFTAAASWASGYADNPFYYYTWFGRYATFWALMPVAMVVGLILRPAVASFCIVMFAVPFVLHSLAAFKSERYLFYAIPYFFILWAVVLSHAGPWLHRAVRDLVARGLAVVRAGETTSVRIARSALTGLLLFVILGFLAFNNPGFMMSFRTLVPKETGRPYTQPDWGRVAPLLHELAQESDVVLTTAYTKTLYYVGRFDYALGRDAVEDSRPGGEFGSERVTARPSISTTESLEAIVRCYGSGLVLIDWGHLNNEYIVSSEVSRYLEQNTERIQLPDEHRLTVYRWFTPRPLPADRCLLTGRHRAAI
jgi:hypothetical protein